MNTYDLNEVFTPSSPASLTFVERTSVNYLLVEAIRTKGKQIVIYGHSGTGKTTLLHNKLLQTFKAVKNCKGNTRQNKLFLLDTQQAIGNNYFPKIFDFMIILIFLYYYFPK